MTLNAVVGTVISDYCWARSVVLLGPLLTTLGMALTIPFSMVVDSFYEHKDYNWHFFVGAFLIIIAFVGMTWLDYKDAQE